MTSVTSPTHQALLDRFQSADWLSPLLARLERREAFLENLTSASLKALVIAAVFQRLRHPLLLITPDPNTGLKLYGELLQYGLPVARTPAEDFSPYDLAVYPARALREHYAILRRLQAQEPLILIASARNLPMRHLAPAELEDYTLTLKEGAELAPETLAEQCLAMGYIHTSLIMDAGEFSHRGDIFDLYPVNGDALRIEFFGDTI
jgi:transcription-repair coupling factor (superfamily II helicase)